MFAPLPEEPVFTLGRRTVSADVPRFLEVSFRLGALFSTLFAILVGGGGGAGGGAGFRIVGDDRHMT